MEASMEMMKRVRFRAMGTDVEVALIPQGFHSSTDIEAAFAAARSRLEYLEQRLSRFDERSDVSYINRQAGHDVIVSVETVTVVESALEAHVISQGLFCPWMGTVMEELGYNVSFEQVNQRESPTRASAPEGLSITGRHGSGNAVHETRSYTAGRAPLHVEPEENRVRIDAGYHLDLGGLAKGWIVEQMVDALVRRGFENIVVNAGGDMVCRGRQPSGPWTVGVVNPFEPSKYLFNIDVDNLAMATSGTYRRRWQTTEGEVHHLLDPRTGRPSNSDVVSCSVLANRLTGAEVLAKTALLLGSDKGVRWLETQPQQGYVLVTQDKEVIHSWNSSMNAKSRQ